MKQFSPKTRGAAFRAQKRQHEDADRLINRYAQASKKSAQRSLSEGQLKISFLGGMDDVGEKNMAIIEWQNDAIVLDCGNNLGVDLPGINYAICDSTYLKSIGHKLRGYVITHGHLDHMGGLRHIVPECPAPIYGSPFTIGVVAKAFEDAATETGSDFKPRLIATDIDAHQSIPVGVFKIECIRVTHAIPESTAICVETPVGRVIATGDFRLDPEPLDKLPTDKARLRELGDQGVLLLLSDSTYADSPGRTPTEHTLQESFYELIARAEGRAFVAVFSSNMNRTQMIINAAVAAGRKVALDGRSMIAYAEIAVRQGLLKVPKGTIIPMREAVNVPDDKILVMCTGGQGEPGAALQRMSEGEHKYITLKSGDTVVVSSTPIPGNEIRYDAISNRLIAMGVRLFRHPTHEVDGCGPLHVSGHARREELREMLQLVRPKFFVPGYGGPLRRRYHGDIAIQEGMPRERVIMAGNGDSLIVSAEKTVVGEPVPYGSRLVDQTGSVVNGIVVKDRLLLGQEGILAVILTIDKKTGRLLTSPDILSRGFITLKDSEELLATLRAELRRMVAQDFPRRSRDQAKALMREHVTHFLFEQIGRSPMVIPVVNIVSSTTPRPIRQVFASRDQQD